MPFRRTRVWFPSRRGALIALATGTLLGLSACSRSRTEILSTGWAWPLPPPSFRSPAVAARARAAADLARLQAAFPWATETLVGQGSASHPRDVNDPVVAGLVRQVQARQAARRQIAERLASLPMPVQKGQRTSGNAPRLGDPGRLTPDQAARLNDLIAHAPIQAEQEATGGRLEIAAALPLANVARVVLGEPIVESAPADKQPRRAPDPPEAVASPSPETSHSVTLAPETAQPTTPEVATPEEDSSSTLPAAPSAAARRPGASAPRFRETLPPVGDQEVAAVAALDASGATTGAQPAQWDLLSPSPEARYEAQRRADTLARQWLWDDLNSRALRKGVVVGQLTSILPAPRRIVRSRVETAAVRSVVWDSLGRCRVTIALDWDALARDLVTKEPSPGLSAQSEPMPLP